MGIFFTQRHWESIMKKVLLAIALVSATLVTGASKAEWQKMQKGINKARQAAIKRCKKEIQWQRLHDKNLELDKELFDKVAALRPEFTNLENNQKKWKFIWNPKQLKLRKQPEIAEILKRKQLHNEEIFLYLSVVDGEFEKAFEKFDAFRKANK